VEDTFNKNYNVPGAYLKSAAPHTSPRTSTRTQKPSKTEYNVADQAKPAIGNTWMVIEKDKIVHVLRLFKGMIVRSTKGHLKAQRQKG
jgi:hypothetical protein